MTNITTLRPGEHFMFKNFEWVCLDPNHPDGGVLAIMAKPWAKEVKFCPSDKFADEKGNWNNYRTSNVRGIISDMANAVFEKKSLLSHTVDLMADNGDRAYGTVQDFVFILTCDEYRFKPQRAWKPEDSGTDDIENLMPSCRMCNHYKRAHDLETFRRYIAEIPRKLQENYIYKIGIAYGNVLENPKAIKFYFEKVRDNHETD